jgi:voltage-dependent calcium channel T type alpha-1I
MRILVSLIIDTLPMIGNVLLLGLIIFTVFGIVGVQMWKGELRNRCFSSTLNDTFYNSNINDYVCSISKSGMTTCDDIPVIYNSSQFTECKKSEFNPIKGSISFDNIGYVFIIIFQVKI